MPKKERAIQCRNREHPEKLIKTFLFDYTLEDGNSFLSRLSLTQLAQEECKGWVGSSPTQEWKEATYQRDDGVRTAAAANSTSTLWDNCLAIFQRQRQLTGKKKKTHLTTSLSGGLDKSGAHFNVSLWQKYMWLYRHLCLGFPEPKCAFIHGAHLVFQGVWQETWTLRLFEYNTCSSQVHC